MIPILGILDLARAPKFLKGIYKSTYTQISTTYLTHTYDFPRIWRRRTVYLLSSELSSQSPCLGHAVMRLGSHQGIKGIATLLEIWVWSGMQKMDVGRSDAFHSQDYPKKTSHAILNILLHSFHPDTDTKVTLEAMHYGQQVPISWVPDWLLRTEPLPPLQPCQLDSYMNKKQTILSQHWYFRISLL